MVEALREVFGESPSLLKTSFYATDAATGVLALISLLFYTLRRYIFHGIR